MNQKAIGLVLKIAFQGVVIILPCIPKLIFFKYLDLMLSAHIEEVSIYKSDTCLSIDTCAISEILLNHNPPPFFYLNILDQLMECSPSFQRKQAIILVNFEHGLYTYPKKPSTSSYISHSMAI